MYGDANGGTLFLDEIGDLPAEIQGKLLRFLQDRVFERVGGRETLRADGRLICATHRDLERSVAEGRFREDLYYRARVVEIEVPPLRTRGEDEVEQLARHFAERYARRYGRPLPELDEEALDRLRGHDWPGNVRELEHWIESAVALSPDGRLDLDQLPALGGAVRRMGGNSVPPGLTLREATRRYVEATLSACGGNRTEAAKRLGIGRNTIGRLLKER